MTASKFHISPPSGTPPELRDIDFTERTWDKPWNIARGHRSMAERMPTASLDPESAIEWPLGPELDLSRASVDDPLMGRATSLDALIDQRIMNDGLLVVHNGTMVLERYSNGFSPTDHHVVHSCSKTLTAMLVPLIIDSGALTTNTPVTEFIPELAPIAAWDGVTLQNLLDMAAGLETEEHYEDPDSMYWRYAEAVSYYGTTGNETGVLSFVEHELTNRVCAPGSVFNYASYLSNLIPILVERATGKNYLGLLQSEIYGRIGAEAPALINVDVHDRPIVEGQVNLTLRDFARWASLYANAGRNIDGDQVIPEWWITEAFASSAARAQAFTRSDYADVFPGAEYHNQAWLLDPEHQRLAMLGIHGQFAYFDRERDLMIVGMSSFPDQANALFVAYVNTLWAAIARLVD